MVDSFLNFYEFLKLRCGNSPALPPLLITDGAVLLASSVCGLLHAQL